MITTEFEIPTVEEYERLAYEYMGTLPLEHHMEEGSSAWQREITLESFALVSGRRPEVQLCNEMLVQYPRPDGPNGQVVPDNMIVLQEQSVRTNMSFNVANEPSPIFMVFEYVSRSRASQRKDYDTNRLRYERELQVPYYMLFDPDAAKLTLLHLDGPTYVAVKPNEAGRFAIPELDLELAILDGWVRYWFEGQLLPLPAEMQAQLDSERQRADREEERANREQQRAEQEKKRAEQEKKRAEQEKKRADEEAENVNRLKERLRSLGFDPSE